MTHTAMLGHPARILSTVGTAPTRQVFGLYRGSVVNVNDPLGQNRIQALVPQILGTAASNWATPLGSPGSVLVKQQVFIMFIGGDINQPAYLV